MQLPHDIHERLERRWLARYAQDLRIRQQKNVLNEAEVTGEKVEPGTFNRGKRETGTAGRVGTPLTQKPGCMHFEAGTISNLSST